MSNCSALKTEKWYGPMQVMAKQSRALTLITADPGFWQLAETTGYASSISTAWSPPWRASGSCSRLRATQCWRPAGVLQVWLRPPPACCIFPDILTLGGFLNVVLNYLVRHEDAGFDEGKSCVKGVVQICHLQSQDCTSKHIDENLSMHFKDIACDTLRMRFCLKVEFKKMICHSLAQSNAASEMGS